jgi:hypothetical protein
VTKEFEKATSVGSTPAEETKEKSVTSSDEPTIIEE